MELTNALIKQHSFERLFFHYTYNGESQEIMGGKTEEIHWNELQVRLKPASPN